MLVPVTILSSIGVLIGAVLFFLGLRGRRIDDHPRCRKCGYDLSGTMALPEECPECGRDLSRSRRPVRIGNRRRRPAFIVAAMLILILSLGLGGTFIYNETRDLDWNTIKPVWLLKREARAAWPEGREARRELLRRLQSELLSESQKSDIADLALHRQADPAIPWDSVWGAFIEHLWSEGELSRERIEQYVQRAFDVNFQVEAREKIRAGRALPIKMGVMRRVGPDAYRLSNHRVSPRGYAASAGGQITILSVQLAPAQVTVDATPVSAALHETTHHMMGGGGFGMRTVDLDLAPGTHEITFTFDLLAWEHPWGQPLRYVNGRPERPEDPITEWTIERTVSVEVVPEDETVVELVHDSALAQQVRGSIVQVEFIRTQIPYPPSPNAGRGGTMGGRNGMIIIDAPPMDLSFDVFARVGDEEKRIGGITARKDDGLQNAQRIDTHPKRLFPSAETFNLVLRAAPGPAEGTLEITRIWDGEIVIEDVPLREEEEEMEGAEPD